MPLGISIYNAGAKMDDVSTAVQVIYDVKDAANGKEGAMTNAAIGTVSLIGGRRVGDEIEKSSLNASQKFATQVVADKTIDVVAEKSMKKVE
jgi:hypothetical protein